MRVRSILSCLLAAFAIVVAAAPDASATHFRYGTLSWAPTGTPGQVRFDLRVAMRRNGYFGFPTPDGHPQTGHIVLETIGQTRINFDDGIITPTLQMVVTDFSVSENWIIAQALDPLTSTPGVIHTYAGPGPYTVVLNDNSGVACCRLGTGTPQGLNNRANGSYPLQTIVRPNAGNRSPVSNLAPIVVVPRSATATFLVPASDPDGDPVRFRLANDTEAGTGAPLHPPNMTVDATTGIVTWDNVNPVPLDATRFWTTQVVIEDLDANGVVKTKTPVDFLLKIVAQQGVSPECTVNPPGPFTVTPGTPVAFTLTGTDPDPGDQIILNGSGVPPGATMTPALPTSGPTGVSSQFDWTPTPADEGSFVISFSATDTFGNQGLCSATIEVVVNSAPTVTCAPDVTLSCAGPNGTPHTLEVHVEDVDGDELTVTWRVNGAVVETDIVPAPPTGPTSANVSMTRNYAVGSSTVEVTVDDGQASNAEMARRRAAAGVFASATCTTVVTVVDDQPPTVTCTVDESMLWPPNHNMVNVGLSATAGDTCTGGSGPADVLVYGDEDDEDPTGDGRFSPDALDIAHQTLRLRSEREGDRDGRVYLILATATDGGGTGHACCTVTVPQNMSPKSRQDVLSQAAAAEAVCEATGAPPAGYFVIGDGPILGPKQDLSPFSEGSTMPRPRAVRGTSKSGGKRNRQ